MKQDTYEYDLLQQIKTCLQCNNEPQAIRLIEKYGFEKQERMYSEEEVLEFGKYLLELSNSAMSKRTNIKMLDLEVGEKLVKDLFEQFKKK